ncbi:hypothetical protein NDU88_006493 [Pleurodeles waltl]|uniref:Uncharacterized protein n=1 Tax=Pleurodeles waltl TaxID=8319 RepID=A0AAV7UM33_PLEWA|nr:hypothetical protein NDU88_006493 [Pleurodeles waltl]
MQRRFAEFLLSLVWFDIGGAAEKAWLGSFDGTAWTLTGSLRSTLNSVAKETEHWYWIIRIAELIGAWPWFSKVKMALKNARNIGDKREGAHQTCVGKAGSDGGLTGRRSALGQTKLSSKAGGGAVKDVKYAPRGAQPDLKGKGRSQPAITNFLTSGVQENGIANPTPLSKDMPFCLREDPEAITHREESLQAKGGPSGSNFPPDMPQDGGGWRLDESRSLKEQMAPIEIFTRVPTNDSTQMQTEEYKQGTEDIQGIVKPLESHLSKGEGLKLVGDDAVKDSELEAGKSGRGRKITDWSRDRGDKRYSLRILKLLVVAVIRVKLRGIYHRSLRVYHRW